MGWKRRVALIGWSIWPVREGEAKVLRGWLTGVGFLLPFKWIVILWITDSIYKATETRRLVWSTTSLYFIWHDPATSRVCTSRPRKEGVGTGGPVPSWARLRLDSKPVKEGGDWPWMVLHKCFGFPQLEWMVSPPEMKFVVQCTDHGSKLVSKLVENVKNITCGDETTINHYVTPG